MKKTRRILLQWAPAFLFSSVDAQTPVWPSKPVRVIVPFPAGGSTDVVGRMISARLSEELGQPFVVENRAGAGGSIGAEVVVKSPPDGYTLCVVTSSYAPNAVLYKVAYDPVKSIAPISLISNLPLILAVNSNFKATNLKEFLEFLRAHSGALNFASSGVGSTPHLAIELLQQLTGTQVTHIVYKGESPAINDLLAGQVHATIGTELALGPHIKSGKLRAIAVTNAQRSFALPDVPSIGELVSGYGVDGWAGIWAPGGTPEDIVNRLNRAIAKILNMPDVKEKMRAGGAQPAGTSPDEFARLISKDVATWTRVVKAANITVQ
ncbi:MAG: tripartite tricarboxylate transporter substrate binding protein [Betaproteobacteria bacterium]|nr:tripartite tricarboxylate transporter substrate binding protein [Betaproteobacteria bacterium]NBT69322.1 tripartite tricarboxylate transporter substrate binding protein [Betaproteobacteria bacterium]